MTSVWAADDPADGVPVRQILLSHLDPIFLVDVADRCARHPDAFSVPNVAYFGGGLDPALRPLLCGLLAEGLAPPFFDLAVTVIEQARLSIDFAGLDVIRHLDPTIAVAPPEPTDPPDIAGRIVAADALCDLLLQPLMAFCGLFYRLAAGPLALRANPEMAAQVFYRTTRPSYAEARLEVLIREQLGLNIENPAESDQIMNVP
jgi:hypothetical protein